MRSMGRVFGIGLNTTGVNSLSAKKAGEDNAAYP